MQSTADDLAAAAAGALGPAPFAAAAAAGARMHVGEQRPQGLTQDEQMVTRVDGAFAAFGYT